MPKCKYRNVNEQEKYFFVSAPNVNGFFLGQYFHPSTKFHEYGLLTDEQSHRQTDRPLKGTENLSDTEVSGWRVVNITA